MKKSVNIIVCILLFISFLFSNLSYRKKIGLTNINFFMCNKAFNYSSFIYRRRFELAFFTMRNSLLEYRRIIDLKDLHKEEINVKSFFKNRISKNLKIMESEKIADINDENIFQIFKIKNKLYCLNEFIDYKNMKNISRLLLIEKNRIKYFKDIKFNFISNNQSSSIIGMNMCYPDKIIKIDDRFEEKRVIKLNKLTLTKAVFIYKDRFYIQKIRVKRGEANIIIIDEKGRVIKRLFFYNQSKKDDVKEVLLLDDTIMKIGKDRIYVSFVYPASSSYKVFIYDLDGKLLKIFRNNIKGYTGVSKEWTTYDSGLIRKKGISNIFSINNIFEDREYLYVATGRNIIKQKGKENPQNYLEVFNKESVYCGKLEIPYGTPIFYDKDAKCFYSVKVKGFCKGEMWRWKIEVK